MMPRSSAVTVLETAVRFAPHALAALVATRTFTGLPQPFLPVTWLFLSVPILESLLGQEPAPRHGPCRAERVACRLAPWLWLPFHAAVLVAAISILREAPDPVQALWLAIPVGMVTGTFGLHAAHELMHRKGCTAQCAAALLFASCCYGHFLVEHVRGHHQRVGMRSDPATARLGESVYPFLVSSVKSGIAHAWHSEAERLARHGRWAYGPRNRLVALGALSLLLCATAALAAGLAGLVFLAAQSAVSVAILEVVNYIQHYGLARREDCPVHGQPTAVHTWECRFRLTNLLLLNMGRHADHHLRPGRRAHQLAYRADAPHMPAGYFTMFIIALLPPLWALLIDPRARLVRERLDRGLCALPAQSMQEDTSHETHD